MKKHLIYLFIGITIISSCNTEEKSNSNNQLKTELTELSFDSLKAKEYGADDYGMKKYVIAFLKRGPNRTLNKDSANALQMAHMENINKMAEAGKLVLAGPFFGDGDLRGIYIFDVQSLD